MEHSEHIKKIKEMVGDFLGEIADAKRIDGSNIAVVKEAVSAYQKICELCEDQESGEYGARRRDSRGRYMDSSRMGGGYGYMPGPYYAGGYQTGYGADNASLAASLEQIANSGNGTEGMSTALREAARWLRQG